MGILDLFNTMIIFYILLVIFWLILKVDLYYKKYEKQKKLQFTKEFISLNEEKFDKIKLYITNEIKSEIFFKNEFNYSTVYNPTLNMDDIHQKSSVDDIYNILSFSNEIAIGVKNGLYDSNLLKSYFYHELKLFYKLKYVEIDQFRSFSFFETTLFNLESLLQEWEEQKFSRRKIL